MPKDDTIGRQGQLGDPGGQTPNHLARLSVSEDPAEIVRQTTVRILGERIRLLGTDRSGAYEHYNLHLSKGFPIWPGELALLEFVRERMPNLRSYHEIGSALGTLPLILSCSGFAALGIERDERRHLTALAILGELSTLVPQVEGNCRLIGGSFPDAVADLDTSESMALLTDFVSSQTPREYLRICHALARYRYVIMDLQRFCTKRDAQDEQDRLVTDLAQYGLQLSTEVIDLGGQGRFVLFESKVAAERRPLPGDGPRQSGATLPVARAPDASEISTVASLGTEVEARRAQPAVETKGNVPAAPLQGTVLPPMPRRANRPRYGGWLGISALIVIGLPALLAIVYYGLVASKQYVTSFQFAVRGPSQAAVSHGGASMTGGGAMSPDSFVVTDYIKSSQAIADVERRLNLSAIFAKPDADFWARLPDHASAEERVRYWNRMVSASFDLVSGNITISVRAFSPIDSLNLAKALVSASDEMFHKLNSQVQRDYVRVADQNLVDARNELEAATQALLAFREKSGLVDPGKTADAGASIIDDLRKQLAGFQAQYGTLKTTAANSPALTSLKTTINTLEAQIRREGKLGASDVKAVSADTLAKFQTLDLKRQTAERLYGDAVSLRTQAYLMAQSQQSYLGMFAAPGLPEASLYPDRPRAIATVILSAAVAWFIGMLVVYALRDHLM